MFKKILKSRFLLGFLVGIVAVFAVFAVFFNQTFYFIKSDILNLFKRG